MQKAEKIGLGVAAAGHVALIIILSLRFVNAPNSAFKPRPVEVTITDEIALEAGAPDPAMIAPAPSVAPEIGLPSEPDYPAPAPLPERVETPAPTPAPAPKPVAKPAPAPKPAAKVQPPAL
ncbi:MAG: hypothetical protein U5J78_07385 [Parasphingorhabdus sp.]|nr:hypothetical protein [Parasphingorhabdus sp.]